MLSTVVAVLVFASAVLAAPSSSTTMAAAATASQIRTDQDPVYHYYIQETPVDGAPVLGVNTNTSAWFSIGSTIQDTNSSLYFNVDMSPSTSYKPLTLNSTMVTSTWGMSGDTIIDGNTQNFVVCPIAGSELFNFYLQTGDDVPSSDCTDWITIHLDCLC